MGGQQNRQMYASFVISFIQLLLVVCDGELISQTAEGCGNKAESVLLNCELQNSNEVATIRITTVLTSFKVDCPTSDNVPGCVQIVRSNNTFYQEINRFCQSKRYCTITTQQLPIPLCNGTIHHGNYVRIEYDCIKNGVTVTLPTTTASTSRSTTTTTPFSAASSSASKYTTSTSPIPGGSGVTSSHSSLSTIPHATTTDTPNKTASSSIVDNQLQNQGNEDTNTIAAVLAPLIILLALIILLIVLVVLHRNRKLPPALHSRLDRVQTVLTSKLRSMADKVSRGKSRGADREDRGWNTREELGVDEPYYCEIDTENGKNTNYQDWNAGQVNRAFNNTEETGQPTMLEVPTRSVITTDTSGRYITTSDVGAEGSEASDDDAQWTDSEFEDSDNESHLSDRKSAIQLQTHAGAVQKRPNPLGSDYVDYRTSDNGKQLQRNVPAHPKQGVASYHKERPKVDHQSRILAARGNIYYDAAADENDDYDSGAAVVNAYSSASNDLYRSTGPAGEETLDADYYNAAAFVQDTRHSPFAAEGDYDTANSVSIDDDYCDENYYCPVASPNK